MRFTNIKIAGLAGTLLLAAGCDKDLLEQNNPNAPVTETFWQTGNDATLAVNGAYSGLQLLGTYSRWLHFAYDLRSDEGFSSSPWGELANFTRFVQTNYNFEPSQDIWNDHYRGIFRTNQVLTYVPAIEMEETLKNQVLGEARFLRALYYYNLVSLYGNVPLALEPSTIDYRPPQGTVAQVWDQVIDDLTIAKRDLPASYPDGSKGRATRGAATALLGKSYMQLRRWSDAARELGEVINSNEYALAANYLDNFTVAGENNRESVFEVQFSDELRGGGQDVAGASEGGNRAQFFGPPGNGFTDGEARRWVYDEFFAEPTANGSVDPRLHVTLFHNYHQALDFTRPKLPGADTLVYGQGFNVRYPYSSPNNRRLYWRKYQNDRTRTFENFDSPINFRVIRYADVLLLYAEALNELGRTPEAYPFINQVRTRVGLSTLENAGKANLTMQQMRMQIMHERVVELAGEGLRWNDLKRWGYFEDPALVAQLRARDPDFDNFEIGKSELLPLLQTDVDIANLRQNPGWE
jgi:starch-binding outer membrane protein, SusD/RagB family